MKRKELSSIEREALLMALLSQLLREEISSGQVLRQLRHNMPSWWVSAVAPCLIWRLTKQAQHYLCSIKYFAR